MPFNTKDLLGSIMEEYDFEDEALEKIEVKGPSGATFEVMHEKEKVWWEQTVEKYLHDFKFTNQSDLQDLDRIIGMELILYRYQQWVSVERDYYGEKIDPTEYNKAMKDKSIELRGLKKEIGINKASRDKDQGDSIADYIENLRRRAYEFGVMRNTQAVKAITLFQQLIALITLHDNCTLKEKKEQKIETEDIVDWIRDVIPEFQEIDSEFRKTSQKYWIDDM